MNCDNRFVARKQRSEFRESPMALTPTRIALRCMWATVLTMTAMILSTSIFAAGQSSTNYAIPKDTINAGIGDVSSTNFRISSSVGDAVAGGAISSVSFQLQSGFRAQLSVPPAVLNLLNVFSRKFHNGLPFDLPVLHGETITGNITVEPRASGAGGGGHIIVFRFDGAISNEGSATALDAALNSAASVTLSRSGNDVIATLTNVSDNKRLNITLTGVNNSTTVDAPIGFLVGDINSSRAVNAADISAVKARIGQAVNSIGVARYDLNADGSITQADVSLAKARAGKVLP